MSSIDEATLLQTALMVSPATQDPERAWAFLIFCGLLETSAHADFIRLAAEKKDHLRALADALLDHATRRSELVDPGHRLARRLWEYFQVGQSLEPEAQLGAEIDEGTQPGVTGPIVVES
ncbi:MAG: hypothetical protein U0228_26045 [Myxococcaceae bacterium]